MKHKRIVIINILLVLAWMIMVFCFSHQPSEISTQTSGGVIKTFVNFVIKDIDPAKEIVMVEELQHIVRKIAHFTLYLCGGILIYHATFSLKRLLDPNRYHLLKFTKTISIVMGGIYAISDEIHQFFIPGRSCEIKDMLIDTSGIIVGVLICCGIVSVIQKIRKHKNKNE